MKEYLTKMKDGSYKLIPSKMSDDDIEIPEWSNYAYKNDQGVCFLKGKIGFNHPLLMWQRHTQPEELPFVDDEPSLNDQYAEIEQVRKEYKLKNDMTVDDYIDTLRCADAELSKHNHYFIDVSDVDEVDFYEIALRYNVTDPCIQHILKKCLAVGNRGHKDFHTDLKDIYDTAARALRIHGG